MATLHADSRPRCMGPGSLARWLARRPRLSDGPRTWRLASSRGGLVCLAARPPYAALGRRWHATMGPLMKLRTPAMPAGRPLQIQQYNYNTTQTTRAVAPAARSAAPSRPPRTCAPAFAARGRARTATRPSASPIATAPRSSSGCGPIRRPWSRGGSKHDALGVTTSGLLLRIGPDSVLHITP